MLPCSAWATQRPDIQVDVTLVTIPLTATDSRGMPVHNLRREDLVIFEDGVQQDVRYLWQEGDLPLTVGIVVDVSSSQMGLVRKHRDAVARFISHVISPGDQAFIVTVDEQPRLLVDLTGSVDVLQDGVARIGDRPQQGALLGEPCQPPGDHSGGSTRACIGTSVWDGVFHAAWSRLRRVHGRKGVILISDGLDLHSSVHGLADAIEACQSAGAPVYSIRYLSALYLARLPALLIVAAKDHGMERLASDTGGYAFSNPKGKQLDAVFARIENELRSQYVVAYAPRDGTEPRRHRVIEVRSHRKDVEVRAQSGYIAP